MQIHWFPGHMARARRKLEEQLALVDVVLELADARIPRSSRNPELASLAGKRPYILVLTREDLASFQDTAEWLADYQRRGIRAIAVDLKKGQGITKVLAGMEALAAQKMAGLEHKGMRRREIRAMVVGIPNVGKSSLINRMVGRAGTRVEDRPGVTRGQQWVRLPGRLELLDTPGLLWPKLEDPRTAFRLAVTGAVKETGYSTTEIVEHLLEWMRKSYPERLQERYHLEVWPEDAHALLEAIGQAKGLLQKGGLVEVEKAATVVLREFRQGKLGRITLDRLDESK